MDELYRSRLRSYRYSNVANTQAAFAELIDISCDHYTKIENGLKNPSIPVHIDICMALGKPSDCFFREDRPDMVLTPEQVEYLKSLDVKELRKILNLLQVLYEEQD